MEILSTMQAAYMNISVFSGSLHALMAQADHSFGKLLIPADSPAVLAVSQLNAMFQEIRDVMNNPTLEFAVLKTFPYRVLGGDAMTTTIHTTLAEIQEV
jgi:hypothetical protein